MAERRIRWYGDQGEEQPDAGDVLTYQSPDGEWYHLVHFATQVRGRLPSDLWLVVTRHQLGADCSIPDPIYTAITGGGRCFPAELRPPRRRR